MTMGLGLVFASYLQLYTLVYGSLLPPRSAALQSVHWKTGNAKVDGLINRLTPAEKVSLVHGSISPGNQNQAGYVNPVPRLGIPAVQLSDGEGGINVVYNTTAIPMQINVGASWSRSTAYLAGQVTGLEAYLLNMTVALAPRVNILRDPVTGNYWQSYSEDPFLNAQLGVQGVLGIQDQGTMANPKQIGPSSSGASSGDRNSIVDMQTLHEVYWSAPGALLEAGAATLMCSYAQINGVPACQYQELFNTVRNMYNSSAIVMSDWTATHSTNPSLIAGLNWEMPDPVYFGSPLYNDIYVTKTVSETYLNRALGFILTQYDRFGLLDGHHDTSAKVDPVPLPASVESANAKLAYEIAVASGILLKNDGQILPLGKNASFGILGPNGVYFNRGTNFAERSFGFLKRELSPLAAIEQRVGQTVPSAVGIDLEGLIVPSGNLRTLNGSQGLLRTDTTGIAAVDASVDFELGDALPPNRTYTWTGQVYAEEAGIYGFTVQREILGDDGGDNATQYNSLFGIGSLAVDGTTIASGYRLFLDGGVRPWSSAITTRAGWDNIRNTISISQGWHNITFSLVGLIGQPVTARLCWETPTRRTSVIDNAVAVAKTVKYPIVFAYAQSPAQHALTLDDHQDDLISAVAAANPNTIVVLNTGEPVLMPWLSSVKAVLQMGFPGQEGGLATSDLLFGVVNPQGRLPVTYPVSLNRTVTRDPAHPERMATASGNATFSEGVNIGYRYYYANNIPTLFPFGYGLSYTTFAYSSLAVSASVPSNKKAKNTQLTVNFTLTNTGTFSSTEVPQVYLGPPANAAAKYPGVQFAAIALVGFDTVTLEPGQSMHMSITVEGRQLSFYNIKTEGWTLARGVRTVFVSKNARDIALQMDVKI